MMQDQHEIIIHVDAAVDSKKEKNWLGIMARNSKGTIIGTWAIACLHKGNPTTVEA